MYRRYEVNIARTLDYPVVDLQHLKIYDPTIQLYITATTPVITPAPLWDCVQLNSTQLDCQPSPWVRISVLKTRN